MTCDHCSGADAQAASRTFDVPGSGVVRLCDSHAALWVVEGARPEGTVEIVEVELSASDVGVVSDLTEADGRGGGATLILPRTTYQRWAAARAIWEDVQAEMTTELAKASVDALEIGRDLSR